ncbi:MAG: hypothetical protein PHC49_14260 [Desulfuromonadaceae bacterium]|nr:hypothetical protein [Desulfuromonadaceae bacterium]
MKKVQIVFSIMVFLLPVFIFSAWAQSLASIRYPIVDTGFNMQVEPIRSIPQGRQAPGCGQEAGL